MNTTNNNARHEHSHSDYVRTQGNFADTMKMWQIRHIKCGSLAICKPRSFCYHIIRPRDKPTESNESICRQAPDK